MNPRFGKSKPVAFTLLELLVVIVIIVLLAALLLPTAQHKYPARRSLCMSRQRQILIGLTIFADDHQNSLPSVVSATNGGAMELMAGGDATACFQTLKGIVPNPTTFVCPTDKLRSPAQAGQILSRTNVSYFVSLDALPTNSPTHTILTGDRNLESNRKPVASGLFSLSTNQVLAWTSELHTVNKQPSGGAFGFGDGHVEWINPKRLSEVVARQNMPTNRLAIP